jgi:hypothetical protein
MKTYYVFSVIFVSLATGSVLGKLTPYQPGHNPLPSGDEPVPSGGDTAAAAASCVDSRPAAASAFPNLQAYLEMCVTEEKETKQKIDDINLSLESSQNKLQEAVKYEKYDDAAVLKSTLKTLNTELPRLEAILITTERIIKETKIQMVRDEIGPLEPPDALRQIAKSVYKENFSKQLEVWKPILEQAKVVMRYIMGRAAAAGARDAQVGHFLSYDGFKKVAKLTINQKKTAASKQNLISIADRLVKAFCGNRTGRPAQLTLHAGEAFDEVLVETGIIDYFDKGERRFFENSLTNQNLYFYVQDMGVFRMRQINDYDSDYVIGLTESKDSRVVVAEVMRVAEVGWLGSSKKCLSRFSCLRLRPPKRAEYANTESLDAALFELYGMDTADKLVSEYKDIFGLFVEFDGLLMKGYDTATLNTIFPSGEELAAFHQVLCNPELSNALVHGLQEKGYNVVVPKVNRVVEREEKLFKFDLLKKFEKIRTLNFPSDYGSSKAEVALFEVYQNYVLTLLDTSSSSITESLLLWDIWNDLPLPSAPSMNWAKDRIPMISGNLRGGRQQ